MAVKFVLEEFDIIEADELLAGTNDIKTLLQTEFLTNEDNILLNKKILELMYTRLLSIESTIKRLK